MRKKQHITANVCFFFPLQLCRTSFAAWNDICLGDTHVCNTDIRIERHMPECLLPPSAATVAITEPGDRSNTR